MKNVLVIGIAGGSGSGKTTLAQNIISHFEDRISLLRHDDYYKCQDHIPMEERVKPYNPVPATLTPTLSMKAKT